jgi:hypothetical protein
MKTLTIMTLAGSILLLASGSVAAQTKTIQGSSESATATIEAIEKSTRMLTIKDANGIYETMKVPADVTRFDALKVGDRITVRYYDNVVVRLKKPNEPAIDVQTAGVTPTAGAKPGGTAATQQTVTVTITAIDPKVPSITVKGPNGYVYSRKVEDKTALAKVKVGDKLDVTWTEALLISVDPAK